MVASPATIVRLNKMGDGADTRQPRIVDGQSWVYVLPWELASLGGVSEVVRNMLPRTRAILGYRPMLLVNSWEHARPELTAGMGYSTIRARIPVPGGRSRHILGALARVPFTVARLARLIRRERMAVINIHFPDLSIASWLLAARISRSGPAVVLSFHGLDLRHVLASTGIRRFCWKWALGSAHHTVVCAPVMKEELVRFGVPPARIATVDNGIDSRFLAEQKAAVPTTRLPSRYVVSVGTFEYKKGHDVLMKAFDGLAARHPDVGLVIVGRRGSEQYLSDLERLRLATSVPSRITFLTDVAHVEVVRIVHRAEMFVLASRAEPFGIAILEAAALCVPVVATDICGVVKRLGTDCLSVVPPDDEFSLRTAMDGLLSDPAAAQERARLLEPQVARQFTWDRVLESWPCRRAVAA